MLLFCPICGNTLTIVRTELDDRHCMKCRTCTYMYRFEDETLFDRKLMKAKEADDVMGGDDAWKNVEQAPTQCTKDDCDGDRAYFFQKQIRSADEPMTTFYKCTTCGNRWREN